MTRGAKQYERKRGVCISTAVVLVTALLVAPSASAHCEMPCDFNDLYFTH